MSDQLHQEQSGGESIYDYRGLSREFLLQLLLQNGPWSSLDREAKELYALTLARAELEPVEETYRRLNDASGGGGSEEIYNVLVSLPTKSLSQEDEAMWKESLPALLDPVYAGNSVRSNSKNFELFRNILFTPGNRAKCLAEFRSLTKDKQNQQMGWVRMDYFKKGSKGLDQKGGDAVGEEEEEEEENENEPVPLSVIWSSRFL